ncbi:MAG TPA: hypothetical protein VNZ94_11640 [Xanthobacteraceae bacterium]|nr:hypothetical protein [Xanthobacteraceae bacterium]
MTAHTHHTAPYAAQHRHDEPHRHLHHHHAPGEAHPAAPMTWSLLRMPLAGRLLGAALLSAAMWAFVIVAMR